MPGSTSSSILFSLFFSIFRRPWSSTLFLYTTLFRSSKGMLKDRVYGIRETLFHDPYYQRHVVGAPVVRKAEPGRRSEEHTSELQSRQYRVCRLLLEKKSMRAVRSGGGHAGTRRERPE